MRSPKYFPDHLHIEPGVVAEFAIIMGLVVCLYGFRLHRAMIFMCGFLVGGLLVSAALENTFGLRTWVLVASWIGCFVVGIAAGCVALAFFPLGVFLVGSMLTYAFTSSLPYRLFPDESSTVLDGAVVLMGGMLALLLVRPFAIVSSSLMGSVTAIWGIGYFAGKYPSGDDIERFHSHGRDRGTWVYAIPVPWCAYLAAMLLLFVIGMIKQSRDASKVRSRGHIGHYTGWRSSPNILIS
ncbi:unnamed protein product [Peronospora belbahrii]|uniref:Transmembrane protein 198 n=1 Tax=Peronospora belbahrii TaxID=622444 RepID=A0AAU9KUB7_9STRA|nr:unnamed protein product [Peronospora belbahrii]CAH0516626.1 unnamed protein product [Peronospora belbahrii]